MWYMNLDADLQTSVMCLGVSFPNLGVCAYLGFWSVGPQWGFATCSEHWTSLYCDGHFRLCFAPCVIGNICSC